MDADLPSLDSLLAFELVARTLSFKDAAAALHVSPSAVSRRVQSLEAHLGVQLFRRLNPGLVLTEAGALYLPTAERVLRDLREAGRALAQGRSGPLRVSALESFSARWLIPHLPEFEAMHPDIRLEIEATLRYADFGREPVDVAIRFGEGPWEDLHHEPIMDLVYFPVCSPGLRDGTPPLRTPDDLAAHTWIHVSQVRSAWQDWTRRIGQPELRPTRDVEFDHLGIALSAAESGQGVALCSAPLCAAAIEAGRLCIPFDLPLRSKATYHLVCRASGLRDPRVTAFRDWLVAALA